jgi:hypothetical protein
MPWGQATTRIARQHGRSGTGVVSIDQEGSLSGEVVVEGHRRASRPKAGVSQKILCNNKDLDSAACSQAVERRLGLVHQANHQKRHWPNHSQCHSQEIKLFMSNSVVTEICFADDAERTCTGFL